jgi:tellurite methyltransferase
MTDGGYDTGYRTCPCFWGNKPGSLILKLDEYITNFKGKHVLDLGCGEGKNSIYLANKGCFVDAYDISDYALNNFMNLGNNLSKIKFKNADVTKLSLPADSYDIIIAYGLFHCFQDKSDVFKFIPSCIDSLKKEGIFILCAFNSRKQDLKAHPNFNPLLISHSKYLKLFQLNEVLFESDEDLFETHPHNNIPHMHSMTRLIIRK